MRKIRAPSRCKHASLAWLALALGCSSPAAPAFATSTPGALRAASHADGVAVDLEGSTPVARERAGAGEAVVTLAAPLGVDQATSLVEALFAAVVAEDVEAIERLYTRDAVAMTTSAGHGGHTPLAYLWWDQRFRRLDYGKLAGSPMFRESEVAVHRAHDGPSAVALRAGALGASDVLLRIRVVTPRLGADRFFGDELLLWLRREGDGYRIYRMAEDFQLP